MKKSFIIYDSWGELLYNLPDDIAGQLIKQIIAYSFDMEQPKIDNQVISAMFAMIKSKLDDDAEAYAETIKKRSDGGRKGMSKRWKNAGSITPDNSVITQDNSVITQHNSVIKDITQITVSDSVSVSDNNIKDIKSDSVSEVIDYLNSKLGTKYKKSKATTSQIRARLEEGHTVEDFKTVIDKKVASWKDDPKMSQYLRPETLFRPSKFESYLNEIIPDNKSSPMSQTTYNKIHNFSERQIDYDALEREFHGHG